MPVDVARGRGPGPAAVGAAGMSTGHGPPPAARGYGAAPGLSAKHEPLCAARGRGLAPGTAPGLSAKHGPLRATCGHGPVAAVRLWWTCVLDSSDGGQQQTTCSWKRRS